MTFRREWFKTYTPFTSDHPIYLGDNSTLLAEGMGDIEIQAYVDGGWYNTYIRNVLYSPQLKKNLYSLSTSTRRGFNVIIKHDKLQIFMDNDLKAVGVRHGGLYRMLFKVTSSSQGYITSENKLQLWHERLAHLPVATLREMATKGLVDGLQPQDLEGEFFFCEGCQLGKSHRKSCYPSDGKNYQLAPQQHRFLATTTTPLLKNKDLNELDTWQVSRWGTNIKENIPKGAKEDLFNYIDAFMANKSTRKGFLEFIYACLEQLKPLGLNEDKEVYKKLMKIFPEGLYVPQNRYQEMFFHMPRQVECAMIILGAMDENGVQPDREMRQVIIDRFGIRSQVFKKYARSIYWTHKFKNASPFPLPKPMPDSALRLAVLGIERICPDPRNQITVYQVRGGLQEQKADSPTNARSNTWIVSGQSPEQQELLEQLPLDKPIYVEGPFLLWLRDKTMFYFMLRAEPKPLAPPPEIDYTDDVSDMRLVWFGEVPSPKDNIPPPPTIHEQDDGVVLALCATGNSSQESLLTWIRLLQKSNPCMSKMVIAFNFKIPPKELVVANSDDPQAEEAQQ
ncbi:ECSIT [Cordylochernes scorpioides]|uniref:Evolutionarily conserved signaling intermediate in Toll pathway, mitochondrial n=1 Tax=Cordylochernes scorpioides TaxID=51811 RepID=A0ABY6K5G6_9ARAC|nr:ECSIT [Cordylochernes scorpioides]